MKDVVVLIHEIYGVTDNLEKLSSLLTAQGYSVIVPSLYPDGYVGFDEEYSYRKFYSDVGIGASSKALEKIIEDNRQERVTLIGFSVGATVAWLHSVNRNVNAVIGFYGSRIRNYPDIDPIAATDLFFCREAGFDVKVLVDELNGKNNVTARVIPGEHGFYSRNDFDSQMMRDANRLIVRTLGKGNNQGDWNNEKSVTRPQERREVYLK